MSLCPSSRIASRRGHALSQSILMLFMFLPTLCPAEVEAQAETSAPTAPERVVVLELTGAAPLESLQLWSELLRAKILAEKPAALSLISREQIAALIPPEELLDCTELCELQLGQRLGASWVISGQFYSHGSLIIKLSRSVGEITFISTGRYTTPEEVSAGVPKQGEELLRALLRALESALRGEPSPSESDAVPAPLALPESTSQLRAPRWLSPGGFNDGRRAYVLSTGFCLTPLVSIVEYKRCVAAERCDQVPSEGRCAVAADQPVRCLDHEQARRYANWRGGRLPIEAELRRAEQACQGADCRALSERSPIREWLQSFEGQPRPAAYPTIGGDPLTGPRALLWRFQPRRGPQAARFDDWMPQSFQSSDLGFRVRLAEGADGCSAPAAEDGGGGARPEAPLPLYLP